MNASPLVTYGQTYCVIDTHNLFICTTLADELLVLGVSDDARQNLSDAAKTFQIELDPDRLLSSYSGGEQIIVCALLLGALLPTPCPPILFVHALETLSARKAGLLLDNMRRALPDARFFTLAPDGPRPLCAYV